MKIEDGSFEKGRARVVIQSDPLRGSRRMYVLYHGVDGAEYVATMDDGSMMLEKLEQGVAIGEEDVMLVWDQSDDIHDVIQDVFGAISVALGMGNDERLAREMGRLEGENKVYKQLFDKAPAPKINEDWQKYISPGFTTPYTVTSGTNVNSTHQPTLPNPGPMSVSHLSHRHTVNDDHDPVLEALLMEERKEEKKFEGPFGGVS